MTDSQTWWTDDRVQATVTPEYILKQFRLEEQDLLRRSVSFGGGVTGHTYLDCILERATRLFLILTQVGVPGLIFSVVDEPYDDQDLPIAAEALKNLRLSSGLDPSIDRRLYEAQFQYLARDLQQGHHVRFLDEEASPVKLVGSAGGISRSGKDGIEKVHIGSGVAKVYGRKRIVREEAPTYSSQADILAEIASARKLAHHHVLSVYGSYSHGNNVFVLLTPAVEYTLNSFVDSPPKHFENLPKVQRREILINWPHCLANGLAWLHANRMHHGALRPSNIVIDNAYRIYLGPIEALPITHGNVKISDIESYQYAAPERWRRAATMQTKAPAMLTLHSGGRTARKQNTSRHSGSSSVNDVTDRRPSVTLPISPVLPINTSKPTSTAYPFIPTSKANVPRSQGRTKDRPEYAASFLSSNSSGTRPDGSNSLRVPNIHADHQSGHRRATSISAELSAVSLHSAEAGQAGKSAPPNSVTVAPSEIRSALVQTWQSAQFDPYAADIFSLGTIIVEIVSFLCKRSSGAFSRHRSAKNRTAGRGGGVADASFHANLGQVFAWMMLLQQDGKKKASKEEGKAFGAVDPIIEIARECLARSADDRPDAGLVEKALGDCIQQSTGSGTAHCRLRTDVDILGNPRSSPRAPPKHVMTATLMQEKELQGPTKHMTGSSFASFNFEEYSSGERSIYKGHDKGDEESFEGRRYPVASPDEEPVDLQSFDGHPDRVQNGADTSGWSHTHAEPRASVVSSDTHLDSKSKPPLLESFFKPASRPPSVTAEEISPARSGRALSPPSRIQSRTVNTARNPVTSDVARQRQVTSTGSASRREIIGGLDMSRSTNSNSGTDSAQQAHRESGHDLASRTSGSSTDSARHRHSILSSTDVSPNRLSVSTLASNTSTIRLSWQQRDVSPISIRDTNKTPNASSTALAGTLTENENEDEEEEEAADGTGEQSRREQRSSAERMYKNLERDRMFFSNIASEGKGKKAEGVGTKRAWLHSRYSILGGRM